MKKDKNFNKSQFEWNEIDSKEPPVILYFGKDGGLLKETPQEEE